MFAQSNKERNGCNIAFPECKSMIPHVLDAVVQCSSCNCPSTLPSTPSTIGKFNTLNTDSFTAFSTLSSTTSSTTSSTLSTLGNFNTLNTDSFTAFSAFSSDFSGIDFPMFSSTSKKPNLSPTLLPMPSYSTNKS